MCDCAGVDANKCAARPDLQYQALTHSQGKVNKALDTLDFPFKLVSEKSINAVGFEAIIVRTKNDFWKYTVTV